MMVMIWKTQFIDSEYVKILELVGRLRSETDEKEQKFIRRTLRNKYRFSLRFLGIVNGTVDDVKRLRITGKITVKPGYEV